MKKKNGIILYDFLQTRGGAEQVTLTLQESLQADIGVDWIDETVFPELLGREDVISLGRAVSLRGWQSIKGLHNFSRRTSFLADYDWVLYSGSNAPVAVHNHSQGLNVLYCHTIPRFAYDLQDYWLCQAAPWQVPLLKFLADYVRHRYEPALRKMDIIVANSENVRRRLHRYVGLDSRVIPPPCAIDRFAWKGQGDYYLSTSRIEPYKRVRDIVRAFICMPDQNLVVASGGSELKALKALAKDAPNIRFTGWLSEAELAELVGWAIATIYIPIDEDFGMSPVESMAAGKPVIGVAEGGVLETVVPGETGILVPANPNVEDIVKAVRTVTVELASTMRAACEARARQFGPGVFKRRIQEVLGLAETEGDYGLGARGKLRGLRAY